MNKKLIFLLLFCNWGISQTYSLSEAVRVALENKESLKASVMDLQSSRQNVKESYSTILPSLRFSSSMSESQFPEQLGGFNSSSGQIITDRISSITSASSNISLTQNIYDGGVWWNTIRQAKNSYKISEQYNRQIKTNIINGVHCHVSTKIIENFTKKGSPKKLILSIFNASRIPFIKPYSN